MNFKKLHDGLDFDCLDEPGIVDDLDNQFVRGIDHAYACIHSFDSHHEKDVKPRYPLKGRKGHCQWRCTSVNLLLDNRDVVRAHYTIVTAISPKFFMPYLCIFKLLKASAKIWDTGTDRSPSHRDLIKSDEFVFADIEIIRIVKAEDF